MKTQTFKVKVETKGVIKKFSVICKEPVTDKEFEEYMVATFGPGRLVDFERNK